MTHDQYRAALDAKHADIKEAAGRAGYLPVVGNLAAQIGDLLVCAEGRGQMARESADEGSHAIASMHRRRAAEYIASARALINTPHGREAYRLYLERTGQ